MEKRKRNHLTLEVNHFIVQVTARKPRKLISDLIFDALFSTSIFVLPKFWHFTLEIFAIAPFPIATKDCI